MKNIILSLFFLTIFLCCFALSGQTVDLKFRITNSTYFFETDTGAVIDKSIETATHLRFYQTLYLQSKIKEYNNLRFDFAGRILTDITDDDDLTNEQKYNANRLSLAADGLFDGLFDFVLGRQFIHPGSPLGSIDGLNLTLHPVKNLNWQIFAGTESHFSQAFKLYEADEAAVYGSTVSYKNFMQNNLQGFYYQKNHSDKAIWQLAGLNVSNYMFKDLYLVLQAHYDFINERLHKLYLSTRYKLNPDFSFMFSLKQQYPQIYENSYFKIFNISQYQSASFSGFYSLTKEYYLAVDYRLMQLKEDQGQQLFLTLGNGNGSVSGIYEFGDLGDQIGVQLSYWYEIYKDLVVSAAVDYSRYRFEKIFDYDNQIANAIRVSYKFSDNLKTDLEYQWLNNRIYDANHRILNHIHFIW